MPKPLLLPPARLPLRPTPVKPRRHQTARTRLELVRHRYAIASQTFHDDVCARFSEQRASSQQQQRSDVRPQRGVAWIRPPWHVRFSLPLFEQCDMSPVQGSGAS